MEKEGKLGSGGGYKIEVDAKGIAKAGASWSESGVKATTELELDVIELLRMAAKHTDNTLDDTAINMIAGALGR